ncbi:MAG: glycosyltransferase 87 family protein, partial [Candidatus Thorarchaeota archaeon]
MSEFDITKLSRGLTNHIDILIAVLAAVNIVIALTLSVFGSQMYPFFILLYIWIAFYFFFVAMLIRRERTAEEPLIRKEMHLIGAGTLTILTRAIFIGMTHHISLDALWYVDFGKFMHMGVVPYTGFYFPYPPVFAYIIYVITSIFQGVIGFRLFSIAMDIAVLFAIWKLVHREVGPKWASTAVMAYTFLPISIIESGWNGHFEPLVSLLLLISLWFLINDKYSMSGIFLGLSIATKIYPLVIFPILFAYIKGWKNRLWFTISVGVSGALTFVPILVLSWFTNSNGTGSASHTGSTIGFLESLFGFLFYFSFFSAIVTVILAGVVFFGVIHLMRLISKKDPAVNRKLYHTVTMALGFIMVAMGGIAALFPFLPISTQVYWRYPIDVGIVRGVVTICIGLLVMLSSHREWKTNLKKHVSINSLLALVGATALLLIAMARQFFYGWYLLWSIPFFLLLRDQRLSYTVILCLLLVYPNYTHDNFASFGFEETRLWEDEFVSVNGWTSEINIKGDFVNASEVSAYVVSDGAEGQFWFDTRNVTDNDFL